jgi:hypothetical protein
MKVIYEHGDYVAQVSFDGACVVHRMGMLPNNQRLTSHVGEKLPSQDWREVRLMGCPDEIRQDIIRAFDSHCATVGGIRL